VDFRDKKEIGARTEKADHRNPQNGSLKEVS
jgi:hypothetical protein